MTDFRYEPQRSFSGFLARFSLDSWALAIATALLILNYSRRPAARALVRRTANVA